MIALMELIFPFTRLFVKPHQAPAILLAFVALSMGNAQGQEGVIDINVISGGSVSGNLYQDENENDWYTFRVVSARTVKIEISQLMYDADLCLYDDSVNQSLAENFKCHYSSRSLPLLAKSSSTSTQIDRVEWNVQAGRYYIRVDLFSGPSTSYRLDYRSLAPPEVNLTPESLVIPEGETSRYTVELTRQPESNVTVNIRVEEASDGSVVTIHPQIVTFTANSNRLSHTITVRALEDIDAVDNRATLRHEISGLFLGNDLLFAEVTVLVEDDDEPPGVMVSPTSLTIDEGDSGDYTVVLNSQPTGDVTVTAVSSDPAVMVVSEPLIFTPSDWNVAQMIELRAVVDANTVHEQLIIAHTVENYDDVMDAEPVAVTVEDNDMPGVTVSPTVLTVDERGTGSYTVVLDSEPTGDVTVTVGGTAGTDISVDKSTLTFTTTNWSTAQKVTVSAMTDDDAEIDRVTLTHAVNGYTVTIAAGVTVTVNDTTSAKEEKIVVEEIVNVIVASTVSNVTSNIGARFSSVRGGGAVLTLAGQPVNIEQTHSELMETVELYGSNSGIEYGREIQSLSEAELLRDSSFKVALAATEDDGTQYVGLSQWTLWGQGDFQTFQNDSESANYDGDLKAGYLGIDTWINEQWLAGIATSRIMVDSDYSLQNSDGGNLELTLTGLHPYLRFVPDERSEYWIILGTGDGEIENQRTDELEPERNEVKMSMGAAGVRRTLSPNDRGVDLAIIGDAGFGRMETKSESGLQTIDNLRLNTWRVRLGVEGSKTKSLAHGATLRSFAEVAGRLDGGAGDDESGLELSVGMFFFNPNSGLGLEVRGRTLLLHSAKDYQEHGGSITGSLSPRSDGLGTNLAVSLRWGAETRGVDTLWREGDIDQVSRLVDSDKAILNSRLGYGIALNRGLLTPYGEVGLHDQGSQHVRVGVDFGRKGPDLSVFSLGLFGERKTNMGGESEHRVNLSGRLRF